MILGVDVHAGYRVINWPQVANAGVQFAFIKCTTGNDDNPDTTYNEGKDAQFDRNVAGAKANGILCGAYLFSYPLPNDSRHPGRSPKEQARKFFEDSKGLGRSAGELPPVLDFEWPPVRKRRDDGSFEDSWDRWKVTPQSIAEWTRECLLEMESLFERKPIVYTYKWFTDTIRDGISYTNESGKRLQYAAADISWIADYPLWIASGGALQDWMPATGKRPIVPKPWTTWQWWQFGYDGSSVAVPGIHAVPVDRDCFNGTLADLRKLALLDDAGDTIGSPEPDQPIVHPDVPLGRPALDGDT